MPIAYYDIHEAHLVRHRFIQDQALFAQDMQTWQLVEQHCQLHMNAMQAAAEQQAMQAALPAAAATAAAGTPQLPGGGQGAARPGAPGPGQASPPAPPGPVTPSRGPT
jgi:hypothetical protein